MKKLNLVLLTLISVLGCAPKKTNLLWDYSPKSPVITQFLNVNKDVTKSTILWPASENGQYTMIIGFYSFENDQKSSHLRNLPKCPDMEAILTVSQEGILLNKYKISSSSTQPCNWLQDKNKLYGAIVKLNGHFNKFQPGEKYSLELNCSHRSNKIQSLWLSYFPKK